MVRSLPNYTDLSLREAIGQMIIVRASGYLFDRQIRYPDWEVTTSKLKNWLENLNLGGVILLGGSAAEISLRTQQLQNLANIPLFIAADIEEGVGQRFAGASWFPPPMALAAIYAQNPDLAKEYARKMGEVTAKEAGAIGINWLLAPVVDINNNPDNPVINVRAFGDRLETVRDLTTSFILGAKSHPILTTAKHFPGHGDTSTDSHLDLPVLNHSESRLAEIELLPFQSAIACGVDSIMSAHLLIPVWDSEYPATLSKKIITGKLRENLDFSGLVITDALIMGGITRYSPQEIAVKAIEAGTDILLMPQDPEVAIAAIYEAVKQGRLTEERIYTSLDRIFQAKQKLLSASSAPPAPPAYQHQKSKKHTLKFTEQLDRPESYETVDRILRESMQMGGNLPISNRRDNLKNIIVVDDLLNCPFLDINAPAIAIPKKLGYQIQLLDRQNLSSSYSPEDSILLQVFLRSSPFRGIAGLSDRDREFYLQLINSGSVQGLILYGSPYILDWFLSVVPVDLPWLYLCGQMPSAQAIALETLLFGLNSALKKSLDFGF
jgi:beta-glucosidase